jgi:hypothetical protein
VYAAATTGRGKDGAMAFDIDEAKVNRSEFGLWLAWTLATTAGMLLGFVPVALLGREVDALWVRLLLPLWAGFLVGLFQWLALRPYLTHAADWLVNGGLGWAAAFALGLLVIQLLGGLWGTLLAYLLFGLIIAVLQWPVLRREIPNALAWVIASVVGWALGALISQLVLGAVAAGRPPNQVLESALVSGLTGLVAGAVTGLALVWIVRQPERVGVSQAARRT